MSVGQRLSQARHAAGLSVAAVAERTRIRGAVIEAIERDDFSMSGGDVYARGHVRALARAVGLDPAEVLAEMPSSQPAAEPAPMPLSGPVEERPPRRGPNWSAAMAAALALVAVVAVWQVVGSDSDTVTAPEPSVTPTATVSPGTTAPSPTPAPTETLALAPTPTDGVVVQVTATAPSWVSVTTGGSAAFEGLMDPGQTEEFTDPASVRLVVGNAGGVALVVNGRDLGAPGASGEVVRLTFEPGEPPLIAG